MSDYHIPKKPNEEILNILDTHLRYEPNTGAIICVKPLGRRKPGDRFDTTQGGKYKYRQVRFKLPKQERVTLAGHHVAWFLYTGVWPRHGVDHRNGDGSNNRIRNLRRASTSQNAYNTKTSTRNTSGVKGVNRIKVTGRKPGQVYHYWTARINVAGVRYELGVFKEYEGAVKARLTAEKRYYGKRSFYERNT